MAEMMAETLEGRYEWTKRINETGEGSIIVDVYEEYNRLSSIGMGALVENFEMMEIWTRSWWMNDYLELERYDNNQPLSLQRYQRHRIAHTLIDTVGDYHFERWLWRASKRKFKWEDYSGSFNWYCRQLQYWLTTWKGIETSIQV